MKSYFLVELLYDYLIGLGVDVSHQFIIDFLISIASDNGMSVDVLKSLIRRCFQIEDAAVGESVVNFLAKNGTIVIEGAKVFANKSIEYNSHDLGKIVFKDRFSSSTPETLIEGGVGCSITMIGDTSIKQN